MEAFEVGRYPTARSEGRMSQQNGPLSTSHCSPQSWQSIFNLLPRLYTSIIHLFPTVHRNLTKMKWTHTQAEGSCATDNGLGEFSKTISTAGGFTCIFHKWWLSYMVFIWNPWWSVNQSPRCSSMGPNRQHTVLDPFLNGEDTWWTVIGRWWNADCRWRPSWKEWCFHCVTSVINGSI